MKSFNEFLLTEKFITSINRKGVDYDVREKYAKQAWDILQASYKAIGGIHGSGFNSIDDMIEHIKMWKLFVKGGKVKAVIMYKDKGGRKSVAIGSDGSPEAKKVLADIFKIAFDKSYVELSGKALGFRIKAVGPDVALSYAFNPKYAEKILKKKDIIEVTPDMVDDLSPEDKFAWDKYPFLHGKFYTREIGGVRHMKVMFGTPGLTIK